MSLRDHIMFFGDYTGGASGAARAAAGLSLLVFAGCGERNSVTASGGPQATHVEQLWWLMLWVCTAVFVIVMALLIAALVRRRRAPAGGPRVEPTPRGAAKAIAVGVGVTAVILFGFLVASVLTERRLDAIETAGALTLTLTGRQWWWDVRYENAQPSNLVTTANEIHIPVGKPVLLKLRSSDVIHSVWIPSLQGKMDLIPGRNTGVWIQADRAGEYAGRCAEFCGYQHAHMQLLVIAQPPAEFQAWLEQQRASSREPRTPDEKRGREVFLGATCVMCHTVRGTSAGSRTGPDLTHLASRRTIAAGVLPNERGHLATWIVDPQSIKPGSKMPANLLKPEDLHALVEYLGSLK